MTDEEVIAAFYACNNAAFDEIHDRWFPRLAGYFRRRGVQDADLPDLALDVLIKLVGTKGNPPDLSKPGSVGRYLFRCAHNKIVDYWKSPLRKVIQGSDPIGETDDAYRIFLETLLPEELDLCLNMLPPAQKQALELYLEGYSTEEIAQKIGAPLGTAGTRIKSARDSVKRQILAQAWILLEQEDPTPPGAMLILKFDDGSRICCQNSAVEENQI